MLPIADVGTGLLQCKRQICDDRVSCVTKDVTMHSTPVLVCGRSFEFGYSLDRGHNSNSCGHDPSPD